MAKFWPDLKDVDNEGEEVAEEEDNDHTEEHHGQPHLPLLVPAQTHPCKDGDDTMGLQHERATGNKMMGREVKLMLAWKSIIIDFQIFKFIRIRALR